MTKSDLIWMSVIGDIVAICTIRSSYWEQVVVIGHFLIVAEMHVQRPKYMLRVGIASIKMIPMFNLLPLFTLAALFCPGDKKEEPVPKKEKEAPPRGVIEGRPIIVTRVTHRIEGPKVDEVRHGL